MLRPSGPDLTNNSLICIVSMQNSKFHTFYFLFFWGKFNSFTAVAVSAIVVGGGGNGKSEAAKNRVFLNYSFLVFF